MGQRIHTRYPLKARVRLSWDDEQGTPRINFGETLDISTRGMAFQLQDSIPLRTYVSFEVKAIRLQGSGSVRFARRKGLRHIVGIEFSGNARWDPNKNPLPES